LAPCGSEEGSIEGAERRVMNSPASLKLFMKDLMEKTCWGTIGVGVVVCGVKESKLKRGRRAEKKMSWVEQV